MDWYEKQGLEVGFMLSADASAEKVLIILVSDKYDLSRVLS